MALLLKLGVIEWFQEQLTNKFQELEHLLHVHEYGLDEHGHCHEMHGSIQVSHVVCVCVCVMTIFHFSSFDTMKLPRHQIITQ